MKPYAEMEYYKPVLVKRYSIYFIASALKKVACNNIIMFTIVSAEMNRRSGFF
jgi:hypothetical protein